MVCCTRFGKGNVSTILLENVLDLITLRVHFGYPASLSLILIRESNGKRFIVDKDTEVTARSPNVHIVYLNLKDTFPGYIFLK